MDTKTFATVLDGVADVSAMAAASLAPVPMAAAIAGIFAITAKSAAEFVRLGMDPVVEIRKMHSSSPLVADVHKKWEDAIAAKFGKK